MCESGLASNTFALEFPELSKAVAPRYLCCQTVLLKERAVRLRQDIREAISNITALGLYASEARVKECLKSRLQPLGHASTLKQALREIKSEMVVPK
jgi:hypothetical protein